VGGTDAGRGRLSPADPGRGSAGGAIGDPEGTEPVAGSTGRVATVSFMVSSDLMSSSSPSAGKAPVKKLDIKIKVSPGMVVRFPDAC
jgi:hypothetical protein